jgi:mannan endo-1,4-beta-mannosidase
MDAAISTDVVRIGVDLLSRAGRGGVSRRAVVAGLASVGCVLRAGSGHAQSRSAVVIDDRAPSRPISRLIYGSNEIGTMDGGAPSAEFDRYARVTARRLGGNLMTAYNWVNNASNAGKDYQHANGAFLLGVLGIPQQDWTRPGIVVDTMHETSLALGAKSLITVPLAGYVAADFNGTVSPKEAAPSSRFVPIRWSGGADTDINPKRADIPQFLARLVARYGSAASDRGIWGYVLDNEPGLWAENHPRVLRTHVTIKALIERSIVAATAIKAIDPAAMVLGPASWGATEMVNF